MDMSLVAAALAMQTGAVQGQIANAVIKSTLDAEKSAVQTLLGSAQDTLSLANVADGIGGNLNVSA